MITAVIITLIAWFAPIPLALQVVATVFMSIVFLLNMFVFIGKITKAMEDK